MPKKRSFLQRLSGARPLEEEYDAFDEETMEAPERHVSPREEERVEGQLPVDMYQTPDEIVIRTFVAGVRPDDINVSISRDMVVIEGAREEHSESVGTDYFSQELFWGAFSRTIMLPQEIDVDGASASAKDGLLSLTLPKLDKTRQTKLKVRGN